MRTASKAALGRDDVRRMVAMCNDSPRGARDRAILLLGFGTGLRRSEIVSLDKDDLRFVSQGVVLTLRRSKTDQDGVGRRLPVPFATGPTLCPVRALRSWLGAAEREDGPLFPTVTKTGKVLSRRASSRAVARIVQDLAARGGLKPSSFAGHSLRSGCASSMAADGASDRAIMRQLNHATPAMAMRYVRNIPIF